MGDVADLFAAEATRMITFPFPVRTHVIAKLLLPANLTKREANRIAEYVIAIGKEQQ